VLRNSDFRAAVAAKARRARNYSNFELPIVPEGLAGASEVDFYFYAEREPVIVSACESDGDDDRRVISSESGSGVAFDRAIYCASARQREGDRIC